ncbi:MAG: hypothetical protein K0S80_3702, partial [Neobacillus sp.]|nr:hypothetical protein [Neobacillus sp.]
EKENWSSVNTDDMKYVTCSIVDENGLLVPYAKHLLKVEVDGAGELAGVGTGNPISEENYNEFFRNAYNGQLLIIVRGKELGKTIVSVIAEGIRESSIEIEMNGHERKENLF